ncbi:beta-taxilin-like [Chenopodium quinoa]|uniref:beta-taxilin-like n=1 Tax=Chenopodium quinoa TaxID=63459 RepID=UPI000B799008|nr:beta-taxilin-like [Chenopodium quinoa]
MDDSAANQLPEVDSLPDGFVESAPDSIAPVTPLNEKEKSLCDYKENNSVEPDSSSDFSYDASLNGFVSVEGKGDKVTKVRTFPVPLSEKDGYEASGESANVSDDGCFEQREDTLAIKAESSTSASGGSDLRTSSNEKDKGQSEVHSADKSYLGGSDVPNNSKEAQSSENLKNRKEPPEGRRKSSKQTFKTEQEFLEFTLKYKQVLTERDAAIAVRDKLESLCRELQRQNKMLMDEFKRVSEEGQNLRSDLSTKFEDAIKDVSVRLEEQKGECISQLKENEMLRDKLKQLAEHYTQCQQQYAQELKQKSLELKIAELKVEQNEEKVAHEQAQIKVYAEKISQLLETEKSLRQQLTADGEKFQQFQDALLKSNEVFETFKQEIEKMSKLTKDLKKENTFLKSKCEKSDFTLIELVEERERMKKQLEKTKNQKEKLESLCRSLQAERKQGSIGSSQADSVQVQE